MIWDGYRLHWIINYYHIINQTANSKFQRNRLSRKTALSYLSINLSNYASLNPICTHDNQLDSGQFTFTIIKDAAFQ